MVWLYDNVEMRIEGRIIVCRFSLMEYFVLIFQQGFDEFMNIVLDEAEEVYVKDVKPRQPIGE